MAWWNGWRKPAQPNAGPTMESLVSAAQVVQSVKAGRTNITPQYASWQKELWDYYDTLGEFNIAVSWRSYMISRVRLRAARLKPGSDEPEIVDEGLAADLVNELFSSTAGQTEMMGTFSTFLDVPGEGWLVGEREGDGKNHWRVMSSEELRRRGREFEVITDDSYEGNVNWRKLGGESFVTRVWRPHKRLRYLAYSPAFAARSAMRELELVNRHIQAQYLSRLASAGVVVFPDEITFPVREEFMDAPDPFVREWIETAAEAIRTPGSASAVVPLPIRIPADYVDKVKFVDFTVKGDDKIIEKRDSARNRLASMINVPADLLFQAGDVNHWGLWQLEEGAIRTYITPDVEIITNAFTKGYLHPRMKAEGESIDEWVVWYDASELMVRPDKSASAVDAYDRLELSGKALRRETGFDEDDAPETKELTEMILKKMALNPTLAVLALEELTGVKLDVPEPAPTPVDENGDPAADAPSAETDDEPDDGPPKTSANKPPAPSAPGTTKSTNTTVFGAELLERRAASWTLQANTRHIIEFGISGWRLKHPMICQRHLASCPFAVEFQTHMPITPGTAGSYECFMSSKGDPIIGQRVYTTDEGLIADPIRSVKRGTRIGA